MRAPKLSYKPSSIFRRAFYLLVQEEEYVEGVQIKRRALSGERLILRYPLANRVGCGMQEESEDMCADTGWYVIKLNIYIQYIYIYIKLVPLIIVVE